MYQARTIPEIKTVNGWLVVYTGWNLRDPNLACPFGCIYKKEEAEYVCKGRFGKLNDEFADENEMLAFVKS